MRRRPALTPRAHYRGAEARAYGRKVPGDAHRRRDARAHVSSHLRDTIGKRTRAKNASGRDSGAGVTGTDARGIVSGSGLSMRAPKFFSGFLAWRWAPCIGLVGGAFVYVSLAVLLVPSEFGAASGNRSSAAFGSFANPHAPERTTLASTRATSGGASEAAARTMQPALPAPGMPNLNFLRRGFSPPLPRTDPETAPPGMPPPPPLAPPPAAAPPIMAPPSIVQAVPLPLPPGVPPGAVQAPPPAVPPPSMPPDMAPPAAAPPPPPPPDENAPPPVP
jgi:hypothetical protein